MPKPFQRLPSKSSTIDVSTPSPYKGLNLTGNLDLIDEAYGLSIQNFISVPLGLSFREGYAQWAWNLPTTTTSLLQYNGRASTSNKHFAVCGANIYDITTGGDMSAAVPVVTGLNTSSVYWQQSMQTFSSSNTNYMVIVNGADAPRIYNGSAWTTCTQVAVPAAPGEFSTNDGGTVPAAYNINTFIDVCLHNQRLWFVQKDSTKAFYLGLGAVGGAPVPFDFGTYFPRGGKLQKLISTSLNMGGSSGTQSYLVAISSIGDVVVYSGSDPANSTTWQKAADWQMGAPVGRRCATPFYGDSLVLTQEGQFALSKYVSDDTVQKEDAITYLISDPIRDIIQSYGTTAGFEGIVYPGRGLMLLNIPQADISGNFQFCFGLRQQGWTQITGWPAQCFGLFNNALYFGSSTYVALAFYGYKDNAAIDGTGGNNIIATALSAYTTFPEQLPTSTQKHAVLVKPYITTGQTNPLISVGVNVDYDLIPIVGSATINPVTGAVWDSAKFDDPGSTWVGSLTTYNQWATPICNPGNALAFAMSVSATSATKWIKTDWKIRPGNQFG